MVLFLIGEIVLQSSWWVVSGTSKLMYNILFGKQEDYKKDKILYLEYRISELEKKLSM